MHLHTPLAPLLLPDIHPACAPPAAPRRLACHILPSGTTKGPASASWPASRSRGAGKIKNIPPLVRTVECHGPVPCYQASKMCTHAPPPAAILRIAVGANTSAAEVHDTYPGGGAARSGCGLTHLSFKSGLPRRVAEEFRKVVRKLTFEDPPGRGWTFIPTTGHCTDRDGSGPGWGGRWGCYRAHLLAEGSRRGGNGG
jgi:hypothetical protein